MVAIRKQSINTSKNTYICLMNKGIHDYLMLSLAASTVSGCLLALQSPWGAFFLSFLILSLLKRESSTTLWMVCLITFFSAFSMTEFHESKQRTTLSPQIKDLQMTFDSIPFIDGDSMRGYGKAQHEEVAYTYRIPSQDQVEIMNGLHPGVVCNVHGTLEKPSGNSNPHLFNYRNYLYERGIHWVLKIESIDGCDSLNIDGRYLLANWRLKGLKYIEEQFPEGTIGMTQALVFGETARIPGEIMESYRELGIIHLLAISGLHVGLIFGCFYYLLLRIGISRESSSWMLIVFLCFYMVITGGAPPVIRASFMLAILIFTRKFGLKLTVLDSLSVIFICLLFIDPYYVFDIGFQLSFAVSFSLVLSSGSILSSNSTFPQLLKVTVIAQLSSMPVLVFHFYEFSLIGFVSNLFFVPVYSLIVLPMALITFLLHVSIPGEFSMPLILYGWLLEGLSKITAMLAGNPLNTVVLGKPHMLVTIGYILLIGIIFKGLEKGKGFGASMVLCIIIVLHTQWEHFDPYGEVVFIDVGQGDSILIKLPFNRGAYLIDTGGVVTFEEEGWKRKTNEYSIAEDVLLPLLKSKGVTSLDKLILTHADHDHIGGAEELIDSMLIKEIMITPNSQVKKEMEMLVSRATRKGIEVNQVYSPYRWGSEKNSFHILSPIDVEYAGNNDSLVVFTEIGGLKWLFTGDLEEEGEREFIERYDLVVDVLKVGHHGSDTSTTEAFLDELKPSFAVISAGRSNRFGHPHPDVIKRLDEQKIVIHTTAEHGALSYRFLGEHGTFFAQHP
ncbi:DNA internalization-related competence protein ComEC/Rec2 [Rossellomorea aquimaris]|uniref:DNA internalization-related competence protein ComEC/Rec2 n=1 Tax=Rossellomorea aquimaris TaxID=189382 RepID=UPI001CD7184A|nr:DNA internalization-related competence protein ComEC/Rec2 [Rossellomorea aquimaris]MCA1056211.1 DNA internalization-related competence protein ComEC/Rec2 [Rossellomorea aquimaris]